tara:strand:+ start:522 stop:1193 length:672 start_codon:yes stop_codon:yes gene_type:complete
MSTLRVNKIELNDSANAYIAIGNTYNVSIAVSGTDAIQLYSNGVINIPSTWTLQAENLGGALAGAYNAANASLANATATFAGDLTLTGNTYIAIGAATSNVGIGVTSANAKLYIRGSVTTETTAMTDDATIYPEFTSNNNFSVTLGGSRTIANPNTPVPGQTGLFYLQQDGTGSRVVSWGSSYRFSGAVAPTLSTTANTVDVIAYAVKNTTSIICQTLLNVGG